MSCNSLSGCSQPPWTRPWSSGPPRRDPESGWSRYPLTKVRGGGFQKHRHAHTWHRLPYVGNAGFAHRPAHRFFNYIAAISLFFLPVAHWRDPAARPPSPVLFSLSCQCPSVSSHPRWHWGVRNRSDRPWWRATEPVSLDKARLTSPVFPSITHSHRTPTSKAHRREAYGRRAIASPPAPPYSLCLFFFLLHDVCLFFLHCSPPPSSLPLTRHLYATSLLLPSTPSLRATNSCCCAKMRLNLTSEHSKERKLLSAHLLHNLVFFLCCWYNKVILRWFSDSGYLHMYFTKKQQVLMGRLAKQAHKLLPLP